jgi:hypothetical protein
MGPVFARAFICALAVGVASGPAYAGAFNPKAGEGVAIVTATFAGAQLYYDGYGRKMTAPGYSKFETQAHVEYGLTDNIALVARPRFMGFSTDHARPQDKSGLGASEFGVQIRLWAPGTWSFAVQASARTPAFPHNAFEDRGGFEARWMTGWGFRVFGLPAFAESHLAIRTRRGRAGGRSAGGFDSWAARAAQHARDAANLREAIARKSAPRLAARRAAGIGLHEAPTGADRRSRSALVLGRGGVPHGVVGRDAGREQGLTLSIWRRF